jgi:arylsulfatase A
MKKFIFVLCLFICGIASAAEKPKLNFVFILADDLGWTDLSCYGSKFHETPNLDKLASQGMKFTQAYSACTVCSPTRAALLTGKYPARLHLTDYIPGYARPFTKLNSPDWTKYLPPTETTFPQRLKEAGYFCATIGKWHLGKEDSRPEIFGFDLNIAGSQQGHPPSYFSPYKNPNLKDGPVGEYLTDRLADETLKVLDQNKDKPFFLYLPNFAVHTPIQAKPELIKKYENKLARLGASSGHTNAAYAALLESLDEGVGRVLKKLDELKIADRTVIVFASDNGGYLKCTTNAPLRAGKGWSYEGGVRVPLIVRWPGVTQSGSVCEKPVITMDFYPTILEIAGVADKPNHLCEGESIVPLLKNSGALKRTALYWHYPHYRNDEAKPYSAIRDGDFKLIQDHETGRFELYNLREDIGETNNLVGKMNAKVSELNKKLELWRKNIGAQMPLPNPNYDPVKEAQRTK